MHIKNIIPTHLLVTLCLFMVCLSACASYGWSDRAQKETPVSREGDTLTLAQFTAPASRQIDVRLGTQHMAAALERCGITPTIGAARADMAHMTCRADSTRSRGAGQALWADVSLLCTVSRGARSHPITLHAQRMISPVELASRQLASAQHASDTDALLDAIGHLDCPSLDGAPLGTQKVPQ